MAFSNFKAVTADSLYDHGYFASEWDWELNLSLLPLNIHTKNTIKIGVGPDHQNGHFRAHGRFNRDRSNGE